MEFAEYRKYVPGDDLRRLDWRAYGRSDRFFVKEFEADTNLRCCLVLDTSGSMEFGSHGVSKIEYARRIAGAIAHIALQQGDAVGLSCVARGIVRNIPPRRNPAHLTAVHDILEQTQAKGQTQLVPVLHELSETIRRRALCIILSDLFVEPELLRGCFQHLRFRRHDVAVFHLLDPRAELRLSPAHAVPRHGGRTGALRRAQRDRRALPQGAGGYLDELRQVILESAVDYHRVSIDEEYEQVLMRFLVGRARSKAAR